MDQTRRITKSAALHQETGVQHFRHYLASAFTALFMIWLLFGLAMLAIKNDCWILVSSIILAYPVYHIIRYYFNVK